MMPYIILVGLLVFSFGYDRLIGWLEKKGYHDGFTAAFVVGGVGVTIVGFRILRGLEEALWLLGCFCCSGLFMVIGSWRRHSQELTKMRAEAREFNEDVCAILCREAYGRAALQRDRIHTSTQLGGSPRPGNSS